MTYVRKRQLSSILPLVLVPLAAAILLGLLWHYLRTHPVAILQAGGVIGHKERNLILFAVLLSIIVVVPVFFLTIMIAWRYRETNPKKRAYQPDFDSSRLYESIWWGVPGAIILVLTIVTWQSTYALDPYKSLGANGRTLTIQVVSMDWKWLFIYPGQHVASVNEAAIPAGQPVDFVITSDSVMNSFWVPSLGGQIYAMPGMITQIHEQADKPGNYFGSPANIAGRGFARMDFTVRALPKSGFDAWLASAQATGSNLNADGYDTLAKPSDNYPVTYFSPVQDNLFQSIVMKYMGPTGTPSGMGAPSGNASAMGQMGGM